MQTRKGYYLRFMQLHSEICGVLKLHKKSFAKVRMHLVEANHSLTVSCRSVIPPRTASESRQ
jgi:hypothetical protein